MKSSLTAFTALAYVFLALLTGAKTYAETPLPISERDAGSNLNYKKSEAEGALQIGLSHIASSIYQELLKGIGENNATREDLLLGLASAQISQGLVEDANRTLARVKNMDSSRFLLRRVLIDYYSDNLDGLSRNLSNISLANLPNQEHGWLQLLKAISLLANNKPDLADKEFEKAKISAMADAQKTEFLVLWHRALITTGSLGKFGTVDLKGVWEKFKDQDKGNEFAIDYVTSLMTSKPPNAEEAIKVVNQQLDFNSKSGRSRLLLVLGIIDDNPNSSHGRSALEKLVEQTEELDWAKAALRILASRFDPQNANPAYILFLDRLLNLPEPHPLKEDILFVRMHAALALGTDAKSEEYSSRLLEEFPATLWKLDALKALTTTAWRANPPKYRDAANYLRQIRDIEASEGMDFNETSLLIADCYFSAGDFEPASSAYQSLLESQSFHGRALFQYIQSLIKLQKLDLAKKTLDNFDFTSGDLSNWWKAEWNLVVALKEQKGAKEAFSRARHTGISHEKLPPVGKIRIKWLQAHLSLDLEDELSNAPALADEIISMLEENNSSLVDNRGEAILAQAMFTKGQALLRLKQEEAGLAIFNKLRTKYHNSERAVLSYLLEANHHSSKDHLVEAQRILVTLAETFPKSTYAPRALYEASINAEQRGLQEGLEEARDLLEDLIEQFPKSDLIFYARLRQGHLLRKMDEFDAALDIYDDILRKENFNQHPKNRALASISKADCLFAIAKTDSTKLREAADRFGDLFTSVKHPADLRVEAGFKQAICLRKANKRPLAQRVCWKIIQEFVKSDKSKDMLGANGKYWASRTIFEFGEMLEHDSLSKEAFDAYALIKRYRLPGEALATARQGSLQEQKK